MTDGVIEVALAGCGHMGRHHARTIHADPGCRLVAVIDPRVERAQELAARTGARVERAIPSQVDAVVVATPTRTHAEVAGPLLDRGQWCLVEKPVASRSSEARELRWDRLVVGHSERFNPAVRAVQGLKPRLVQSRRMATHSPRGRDVDVVVDLMIHDLDLVLCWAGDGVEVEVIDATGVRVHGDHWDVASVRLRAGDLVASLAASRVAVAAERRVEISGEGSAATLDLLTGIARVDGRDVPEPDERDALTAQWQAFTQAVRGGGGPCARGEDGVRALGLAERIRDALRGQEVT